MKKMENEKVQAKLLTKYMLLVALALLLVVGGPIVIAVLMCTI